MLALDQRNRLLALNVEESFIVQAPAGSGKTELLMQRFLALLAYRVEAPESVLAITFTNKAAREMKERILMALENADKPAPHEAHSKQTWQLARAVLDKDKILNWNLVNQPSRLKIQTIDAFCLSLTQALPILSTLGASLNISTDPTSYYVMAAENLLAHLETDSPLSPSLLKLLHHLDNQQERTKTLLVEMLKIRDQWLPYLVGDFASSLSVYLQNSLQHLISDNLHYLNQQTPRNITPLLLPLLCYFTNKPITHLTEATLQDWQNLATRLLTKTDTLRQRWGKDFADFDKDFLYELRQNLEDNPQWLHLLAQIQSVPTLDNEDPSYVLLQELIVLLPYLVAELNLVFQEEEGIDFSAIAEHALLALGGEDAPTDLALALDQKIQHILIDEFQDTSITQFRLLEKLTLGWQPGDGHTLFLVGDPMQSIYRFRQAEVSLFLRVKEKGLGPLQLIPLALMANFRSTDAIVDWNNSVFETLFPANDNMDNGAIAYHMSFATRKSESPHSIFPLAFDKSDRSQQAKAIIRIIRDIWARDDQKTIGILVKARSHLPELLVQLNAEHIPYQAVEIEYLQNKETVQDLLSLSLALLNLGDRLSWLSLLRCPWLGFCLSDLTHIANIPTKTIYEALNQSNTVNLLSDDGKRRLNLRLPALKQSLKNLGILSFSAWIENTWRALEGPRLLADDNTLHESELFFSTLRQFDHAGIWPQPQQLKDKFAALFATPLEMEKSPLQIMTIHKAKGLEFDCVILPRLEASPPVEKKPLLTWLERTRLSGSTDLLLAPIPALEESNAPLYDYIRRKNKAKLNFENTRVLYVAATRARLSLYLLYGIDLKDNEAKAPLKGSFLHALWPVLQPEVMQHRQAALYFNDGASAKNEPVIESPILLKRFTVDNSLPALIDVDYTSKLESTSNPFSFSVLSDTTAQQMGIVLHRILYMLSQQPSQALQEAATTYQAVYLRRQLQALGVHADQIKSAIENLSQALLALGKDPRAAWILDPTHLEAHSEYALTGQTEKGYKQFILDRTFIDEKDQRWIIDYKTSQPKPDENLQDFYNRAQLEHAEQLTSYGALLAQLDKRPIYLGLYFPLFQGWHSWCYKTRVLEDVDI
jgi:ATP-dependent exoDNAse (exonuclease V) beta subunit